MANCCVWDITIPKEHDGVEMPCMEIISTFKSLCKKWAFQLERGESGYVHYQCRVSMKSKMRQPQVLSSLPWNWVHISPTSKENRTNNFYVTKEDTRVLGPWTDTDFDVYVQKRFIDCKLRPWQNALIDTFEEREDRLVNVLIDEDGNKGKGFITAYCHCHKMGFRVPPINDAKDMMAIMCDRCLDVLDHDIKAVFLDLPRSMPKNKLQGIYSAVEQIKDGYLYDTRYRFRECWIEPPVIWVFTNVVPDGDYLSMDRWRFWKITKDGKLKRIKVD